MVGRCALARAVGAITLLGFGAAACGDDPAGPAGSDAKIAISIVDLDGPAIRVQPDGAQRIRCEVTFRARVTGTGTVRWLNATVLFFMGADRDLPVDTLTLTASEVQEGWGDAEVNAGETVESRWFFEGGAPFAIDGQFHYARSGNETDHADFHLTCGPEVPANSPPPTITQLTLAPPVDGLEPMDTLSVTFTASSSVGIWATAVELSGPCEAFIEIAELLPTSIVRTVAVEIPRDCRLGVPVKVTVYAMDAGLRIVARESTGPPVGDHTPPTISILGIVPTEGASTSSIHFSADTLRLSVAAHDNRSLRTIEYELSPGGVRDSVSPGSTFFGVLRVPIPAGVTGPVQVRLVAHDVTGLTSQPVTTAPDAIVVYPTIARPTLHTVLDGDIRDIVVDARGPIYVIQWNRARITVLSSATLQITRTIALPYFPTSLDFTPDGDSLLVTGGPTVSVVDLRPSTPVVTDVPLTLNASLAQRPQRVVVLANGKAYLALTGNTAQSEQLLELDLATGANRIRSDAADGNGAAFATTMQRSPDHLAFVYNGGPGHFRRYDATTDQFTFGANAVPYGVMMSSDRGARHSALSLDIYDVSLAFVRRVESIFGSGSVVVGSTLSADGEFLYYVAMPGIMRSRVSDGRLLDRIRNPIGAAMIRVASDDSFLVTAVGFSSGAITLVRLK